MVVIYQFSNSTQFAPKLVFPGSTYTSTYSEGGRVAPTQKKRAATYLQLCSCYNTSKHTQKTKILRDGVVFDKKLLSHIAYRIEQGAYEAQQVT